MVDTRMTKSAGEHWVCSVLARLGWGAALTRDGLERTDILAVHTDGERRMVEIQVKSATENGPRTNWLINEKAQRCSLSDREWFVFVIIPVDVCTAPRTFVVPRDHVVAAAWIVHQDWATDSSVPAGRRNAPISQARVQLGIWERYENRWDLLIHPAADAPVLLPGRTRDLALDPRVGLPPGHPWADKLPAWA